MTADDIYNELMQRDLDGTLSDQEKKILDGYLEANPSIAAFHEVVQSQCCLLNQTESVDPPKSISEHVMRSIDTNRYTTDKSGIFSSVREIFHSAKENQTVVQFSFVAAAAAVIVVIGVYSWDWNYPGSPQDSSATMVIRPEQAGDLIDHQIIDVFSHAGEITTTRHDDQIAVKVIVTSDETSQLKFHFDPEVLHLVKYQAEESSGSTIRHGEVAFPIDKKGVYSLIFDKPSTTTWSIQVTVGTGNETSEYLLEGKPESMQEDN
jgi:hypothetical protein